MYNHPPDQQTDRTIGLTRKEIAVLFTVSIETVKRRTAEGLLKPTIINSRVLRYTLADVRALARQGYRMDLLRAREYGIQPEGVSSCAMPALKLLESGAGPGSNSAVPNPSHPTGFPENDYSAGIFLAQLQWALRQPSVRNLITQIVREERAC